MCGSYRVLQHPALLQCLSQCSEVTPYLLVMEHCPLVSHQIPGTSLTLRWSAYHLESILAVSSLLRLSGILYQL